jgi:glycosyltransferase involved in cell wall biosynthesis
MGFLYKGLVTKFLYKLFFDTHADIRIFEDIYLAWNSKIPSVVVLHAVWSDNLQSFTIDEISLNKLKKIESSLINNIKFPIFTVSQPYLEYISEVHFKNYVLQKIHVVELGLDQSNFKITTHAKINKKSIVYCGALEARKNVLFLMKVFRKISLIDSEFKLTIIGEGPESESLRNFAKENIDLNITFLGKLSHEKVLTELSSHGIYIHTSTKESFSYSLLEAKLSGLKTVAYRGLEVPKEFIDFAVNTFEIDEWCNSILNIDWSTDKFDSAYYSAERMTISTLNMLQVNALTTH